MVPIEKWRFAMADENITTNAHADEIAALKKQMEEMQKRLEELS